MNTFERCRFGDRISQCYHTPRCGNEREGFGRFMSAPTPAPTWQPERENWSTTQESYWNSAKACWVTIPENGLTPDCEILDENGRCACGRSA